jgi:hypothetical protein
MKQRLASPLVMLSALVALLVFSSPGRATDPIVKFAGDLSGNHVTQTVTGLQGFGVSNTVPTSGNVLSYSSGLWRPAAFSTSNLSPGTPGQVLVTNGSTVPAWTSLISYETTHGRFTSGTGSDWTATLGPVVGFETSRSGVWLLPNGTAASGSNPSIQYISGNGLASTLQSNSDLFSWGAPVGTLGALGTTALFVGGSSSAAPVRLDYATATTPLIQSGTSATKLTLGTNNASGTLAFQTGSAVTTASIDTRGRITAGGSGSDLSVTVGPKPGFETTTGGLFVASNNTLQLTVNGGAAEMDLTATTFAMGAAQWWLSAGNNCVAFNAGAGCSTTAPLRVDFGTATTPLIQSGTSATSLTVGTNNAGATLKLQADATSTIETLSKTSSTSSTIVFSSPGLASAAGINVNDNGAAYFGAGALNTNYILFNGATNSYVVSSGGQHVFADNAANTFGTLSNTGFIIKGTGTPVVRGDTTVSTLTVGTNKAGASLVLQGDAATTIQTISATGTDHAQITAPAAPSAGNVRVFVDSADGRLKAKNPNGDVFVLTP